VWFWVAGVIGAVCVILSIVLFVSFISSLVDDLTGPLTELESPGEVTLQLEEEADRSIYRKLRESGAPLAQGAPDPICTVEGEGGATVEVSDSFEWTLKRDGDRYEAIYDFTAPEAGSYVVSCEPNRGSTTPVPLAIGEGISFWDLLSKAGASLILFFGGLTIAGTIAIVTAVMRDNHKKRLQREALQRTGQGPPAPLGTQPPPPPPPPDSPSS
jgi:hypothetical protein